MNRKNIKFEELEQIIIEIYGLKNISRDTVINYQKTVSEDNNQLINLLVSKYNVDMNEFKYYDYFKEDEFVILNIYRLFLSLFGIKKAVKRKLTLNHILEVMNKGKWFDLN